jgi:hypothetical protein
MLVNFGTEKSLATKFDGLVIALIFINFGDYGWEIIFF